MKELCSTRFSLPFTELPRNIFFAHMRRPDIAGWSSLVARRAHNPEVVGSNPAPATKNLQLVGLAGELFCYPGIVSSVQFSVSQSDISICNTKTRFGRLGVTDRDVSAGRSLSYRRGRSVRPNMYMSVKRELGNFTRELGTAVG